MHKFYSVTNKSFSELGVASYKELWDKVKGEHSGLCVGVQTKFVATKASDGTPENKFTVIMSTATEDRHGDVVKQNWDLTAFKNNPVFLDSHNYNSIEHILGKFSNVYVNADDQLQGDVEFMLDNPKGMLAFKMALGGFLNATSVGFIPKEFDDKGTILKSELLENSAVSVPANSEALFVNKSIEEIIADVKLPEEEEAEKAKAEADALATEPEAETKQTMKSKIFKSVIKINSDRKVKLVSIMNTLKELDDDGHSVREEKKRKLFRDLRQLL